MANIKSAEKRIRTIETKTTQNKIVKKAYKEAIKAFEAAVKDNASNKEALYTKATSAVDKAWSKGVLARNTASRKKASLAKMLSK
ncbi:MAG: 30S ribosomal protein S20 [Clostridia bacterium]|nr:30S ribosomal protein S20 [Clostridia bacterium]